MTPFNKIRGPPRLFPLSSRDVAAFLFASMGLTLGASGGIGGGGIVVPVYILVAGLTPKMAIPLGAVTVFGGSVASTYMNAKRRHPLADRPIIDWDLVLVTEPLTLIGALFGVLLHRVLSEKFLIVLLVLLLSVSAHSTLAKAKRMHDAETRYIRKLKAVHMTEMAHHIHVPLSPQENQKSHKFPLPTVAKAPSASQVYFAPASPAISPIAPSDTFMPYAVRTDDDISNRACENLNDNTTLGNDTLDIDNDNSFELDDDDLLKLQKSRSETSTPRQMGPEERQQILILNPDFITLRSGLIEQEKFLPRSKIIALCLMFSILMFLNIMVGGGAFPSPWGIRCGSVAFWVVQVIMVAFLVASAWAAQTYLINRYVYYFVKCSLHIYFASCEEKKSFIPCHSIFFLADSLHSYSRFSHQQTRNERDCPFRLCARRYQVGCPQCYHLPGTLYLRRNVCWYVWYWRRNDYRSFDASHGCPPSCSQRYFQCHDFVHQRGICHFLFGL